MRYNTRSLEWENDDHSPIHHDNIELATPDRLREIMLKVWAECIADPKLCMCPGCQAKRELRHRRNMARAGEGSPFDIRMGRREVRSP